MSSFWLILKQQWTIKISSFLFSIFSLAAILVVSQDHRTQFWKRVIQWPFHQSLVAIGTVVSEEKIKMWNVDGRTTDEKWWQYLRPGELKTNHSADLWQVLLYFSVGNLEHQHVTETSTTMRCPRQSIIKCQW